MNLFFLLLTIVNITITIKSTLAYGSFEEENVFLHDSKLPVDGSLRKDLENPHQIQARRIKVTENKKFQAPEQCTFQGKIAIIDECGQYLICQRAGTKPIFGICEGNKRFHHQLRQCMKMSLKECQATMCQTKSDKFLDPYTKENYLTCLRMFPEVNTCPEDNVFDDKEKKCIKGSTLTNLKSSNEADQMNNRRRKRVKLIKPNPFSKN